MEIEQFVNRYTSKSTKASYKCALNKFFDCIGYEADSYFDNGHNYESDIEKFFVSLNKRPPKTIGLYLAAVKTYFKKNKVKFDDDFWDDLNKRKRGTRARTIDRIPEKDEMRAILSHMGIKGKALYTLLLSSGMRIGESLQLTEKDIDFKSHPVKITIRGEYTKTGNPRITFISDESRDFILQWRNVRNDYIKTAVGRSWKYAKSSDDPHLFPFTMPTAWMLWSSAVKKAGLEEFDPSTNRRLLHPHVLRKAFRNRLIRADVPEDVAEAFMGHGKELTEAYRRYSNKELAELYLEGMNDLSVFVTIQTDERINDLDQHLKERDKQISNLQQEIHNLRNQVGKFQNLVDDPEFRMQMMNMMAEQLEKLQQKKK